MTDLETYSPTHRELVARVGRWLRLTRGNTVVICERVCRVSETPDCLAFRDGNLSTLVECKASRADFHADVRKPFRTNEAEGVGDFRWYAAPAGILTPEDMPAGWGLIEVRRTRVLVTKVAEFKTSNKANEVAMLTSAIRRLEIAATVFVRPEAEERPEVTEILTQTEMEG